MATLAPMHPKPNRRALRMAEVFDAAAAVFAEKGYHGTSTKDIADRLGLQQGSLYYYFTSKEEALRKVCEAGVAGFVESLRQIAASEQPAAEKLAAAIENHMRPLATRPAYVRVFLSERGHLSARHRRRAIGKLTREYEELLADLVAAGVRTHVFRSEVEPRLVAMAILGMCNWASLWHRAERDPPPATLGREFAAYLLRGIQKR
jgi:AcrR family transcriptional regulator